MTGACSSPYERRGFLGENAEFSGLPERVISIQARATLTALSRIVSGPHVSTLSPGDAHDLPDMGISGRF